jgi:hypothetical protein
MGTYTFVAIFAFVAGANVGALAMALICLAKSNNRRMKYRAW